MKQPAARRTEDTVASDKLVLWRKATRRALKRQRRLQGRLRRELDTANKAPQLRAGGEALKTQLHLIRPGSDSITVSAAWLPDGEIVVELRRDLSPRANLARIFTRAKGFDRAREDIAVRLRHVETSLAGLELIVVRIDGLFEEIEATETVDSTVVAELIAALKEHGARLPTQLADAASRAKTNKRSARKKSLPTGVRAFTTSKGGAVIAGRDAMSNDSLVTRVARGRDFWLHIRDQPGAHVVLRANRMDSTPDSGELLEAAVLCAHLSGIAKGTWTDVAWTRAKHVRKPKRAPPGLVLVAGEKTLRVRVDAAVIDGFYRRREAAQQAQVGG